MRLNQQADSESENLPVFHFYILLFLNHSNKIIDIDSKDRLPHSV